MSMPSPTKSNPTQSSPATSQADNYVLGDSVHEYERLTLQARILRPYTDRFFRTAGVAPGMRVLDVGSGMGDVALLAADIVGPGGSILGIDRDPNALENARRRTVEQGCSSWVNFQAVNLDEFPGTGPADGLFDAIIGRYVLMYQPDPGATLRHLLQFLKPGGVVVFHEIDFTFPQPSDPPCALWDQTYACLNEAFRRAKANPDFGRRLAPTFLNAGLPFPTVSAEIVVGGGKGSYVHPWLANTLISVVPRLDALGLKLPEGVVPDRTLAARLEEEAIRSGSQIQIATQYGAWTRKP
jgi:ubiquinone/menaquinone biosynthesis C-methylase UbiE